MAVYQGARPRGFVLRRPAWPGFGPAPDAIPARPGVPDRRRGAPARSALRIRPRRVNGVGAVLGTIVVLFILGFFSLTQSVQVSATSYDIVRLASEQDRLDALARDTRKDLSRLGSEPAVRKLALDAGLGQLNAPIILPAR